jgi:hypothetical protein
MKNNLFSRNLIYLIVIIFIIPIIAYSASIINQSAKGNQSPTVNVGPGGKSTINYHANSSQQRITGRVSVRKCSDLNKLSKDLGLKTFDLRLDDNILTDYYLMRFRLNNDNNMIERPLTFRIDTGTKNSKIIDIDNKIYKPKNKIIQIRNSIPNEQWTWPDSGIGVILTWDKNQGNIIGYNVYRSIFSDCGYGQINPNLINTSEWVIKEKARRELYPVYYAITAVSSARESLLSDPFEFQNGTPLIFNNKSKDQDNIPNSNTNSSVLQDSSFADGIIDINFSDGLDSYADIEFFIICKALPGSKIAPTATLIGAPSVIFTPKNEYVPIIIPKVDFKYDKKRKDLTPQIVKFFSLSDSIILYWEKPISNEFAGVCIYRTTERKIGDLSDVKEGNKIYQGQGLKENLELSLPTHFESNPILSTESEGVLRYRAPAPGRKITQDNATKIKKDNIPPEAPLLISIGVTYNVTLNSDYYIDTPNENQKTFTYIVYGYDNNYNTSYPIMVNASLANTNNCVKIIQKNDKTP